MRHKVIEYETKSEYYDYCYLCVYRSKFKHEAGDVKDILSDYFSKYMHKRGSNFRLHIFFPPLLNRFGFMSPNISINRGIQNKITIIITFSIQWIKIFLSIINAWYNPFPHFTQTKKSCIYSYFLVKYKFVNFLFLGLYCPSKLAICIDSISSFSSFIL